MSVVDRTKEFSSIIASHHSRRQQQQRTGSGPPKVPVKRSEFAAAASLIGADIHATASKLTKLTQLAQSKSLFEDPTVEINELTFILKQDITSLNSKLASLQGAMAQARATGTKQRATHSNSIVDSLKTRLLDATKEFQDVLHTRSHNIQVLQSRREQFSTPRGSGSKGATSCEGAESSCGCGSLGGSSHMRSRFKPPAPIFELAAPPVSKASGDGDSRRCDGLVSAGGQSGSGSSFCSSSSACVDHKKSDDSHGADDHGCAGAAWANPAARPIGLPPSNGDVVIDVGMLGGSQQQMEMAPALGTYYDSRAQAVESVQSTIVELGGIFQQLAVMVEEQGTLLQRLDDNVDTSLADVRAGHAQLVRYLNNMSSNRPLLIKVFAILFFFVVIWGTLFA